MKKNKMTHTAGHKNYLKLGSINIHGMSFQHHRRTKNNPRAIENQEKYNVKHKCKLQNCKCPTSYIKNVKITL